ncbi:MAG: fibronectin type III domain-containing protein, partial [Elusimicrobiales bacterium]|nr:fibronectin type III domain-containing protein [Elusimicrobiales bacterium]
MGYPYYTLNAGSEKSGAFAFTISTNGTQAIEYWAKDNAENEEAAHNNVSFKIDKSSPVSSVAALSQYQTNSFSVSWSGSDIGDAEISSYTVQYKAESGDWTNWLTNTVLTESVFGPSSPITLQDQTTYYFRCLAKDNAGNIEEYPGSADAFTLIDTSSPSAPTINSSSHDEGVYNLTNNDPVFEWTVPSDVSGIAGYSMV